MLPHSVTEQEILAALRQTPAESWPDVLAFVQSIKNAQTKPVPGATWTAAQLLQLPREQRDAIIAEQAARAAIDYSTDPELTGFDAYGADDLHVDSADTQTR
jgi:hypothetical protein